MKNKRPPRPTDTPQEEGNYPRSNSPSSMKGWQTQSDGVVDMTGSKVDRVVDDYYLIKTYKISNPSSAYFVTLSNLK